MHELTIAQSVIGIVSRAVPEGFKGKVAAIHTNIGTLSGIENDALLFSFDIIKKDSIASGAQLIIHLVTAKAKCNDCGFTIDIDSFGNACPHCHQYNLEITQGKELQVTSIEYDE